MQDPETVTTPTAMRFQCRHILASGIRCRAICLRHEEFCYFHHHARVPIRNPAERKSRRAAFTLPFVEDRASIQVAIAQTLCRIALNQVDPRRAGLLLYGLQIAALNLPRQRESAPDQPAEVAVQEFVEDPNHGYLAPRAEFVEPAKPLNIEQILMREWAKDQAQAVETNPQTPQTLPTLQATADSQIPANGRANEAHATLKTNSRHEVPAPRAAGPSGRTFFLFFSC